MAMAMIVCSMVYQFTSSNPIENAINQKFLYKLTKITKFEIESNVLGMWFVEYWILNIEQYRFIIEFLISVPIYNRRWFFFRLIFSPTHSISISISMIAIICIVFYSVFFQFAVEAFASLCTLTRQFNVSWSELKWIYIIKIEITDSLFL